MLRPAYSYRDDTKVPAFPDDRAVIVFDGMCVICSRFAQLVMRNDTGFRFRLLAAQSPLGIALCEHYGLDPVNYTTNILIENGVASFKSDASIRILQQLRFPWPLIGAGWFLPRAIRDRIYDVIARNRLRWFGLRETCYMPQPGDAERFL
jgi:predicted DCC family thiol-disulfide oxidoreductase YuxK